MEKKMLYLLGASRELADVVDGPFGLFDLSHTDAMDYAEAFSGSEFDAKLRMSLNSRSKYDVIIRPKAEVQG